MGEGSACGLYLPSPLDIVIEKRLKKWILGVDFLDGRSYYNSINRSKRSAQEKKGKVKTNQDRKTSLLKGWAEP